MGKRIVAGGLAAALGLATVGFFPAPASANGRPSCANADVGDSWTVDNFPDNPLTNVTIRQRITTSRQVRNSSGQVEAIYYQIRERVETTTTAFAPDGFQLTFNDTTPWYYRTTMRCRIPAKQVGAPVGKQVGTPSPAKQVGTPTPQAAPATPVRVRTHVVRSGETLWKISQHYGVSVSQIAAANNISNTSLIRVGQRLSIPG